MNKNFKIAQIKLGLIFLLSFLIFATATYLISIPNTNQIQRVPKTDNSRVNIMLHRMQRRAILIQKEHAKKILYLNLMLILPTGFLAYYLSYLSLEPLKKSLEQKESFARAVSHEIRTPLANIKLEVENTLREKSINSKEIKKVLKSILEETDKIEGITTGLLSIVREENTNLKNTKFKASSVIKDAIKLKKSMSFVNKIKIKTEIKEDFIIKANYNQLLTAVSALLDNAIKYSKKGGVVKIRTYKNTIEIKDNGIGISKKNISKIFEEFYREPKKEVKNTLGTGIGLFLVKEISKRNNFKIDVQSKKGKGTTIKLIFPS